MTKMSHGRKSGTRKLLTKSRKDKNKNMITKIMQDIGPGDRVCIDVEPSIESGMVPVTRFQGLTGKVIGKQGRCYVVEIKCGGKLKKIITGSAHLKKVS